jgi:hypothetical protein
VEQCEVVVVVGLVAMEGEPMGHREVVASEVAFEVVAAEAIRHIELYDY